VIGGILGAAAGSAATNQATLQQSIEWTVRLEDGRTISVIQAEPTFARGQRVQVIQGRDGLTRLAAA
jgi:outer membrane lipoprotein SlyB